GDGGRPIRVAFVARRPFEGYDGPVSVNAPGPDGRLGTADDGAAYTAYNLASQYVGVQAVNLTTNLPDSANSDYYTWEITATRREIGRWSLLASFAETWNRETSLGGGGSFTPDGLSNPAGGGTRFSLGQGKTSAPARLPSDVRGPPTYRHQSGTPFGRTFIASLNYGNATILAQPVGAERTANINVFDVRSEKALAVNRTRITVFLDAYNIFNTNAEQALTTSSGASYLRPTAITPPRIARVGVKFQW